MEPNIKKIWGIAKSPELKLTDEELHLVVQAHTGKDLSLIHIYFNSDFPNYGCRPVFIDWLEWWHA